MTSRMAADIKENVELSCYDWVNGRQLWAPGTIDLAKGKVHLEAFG